jgi:hypothetical protein
MASMPRVDAGGLRRARMAAQLLHRPAGRSPAALVRHLVGIQAQERMAAELGIRARSPRATLADVDRARLEERSIVRAWAMRGTIHFVHAEDLGWLVPLATESSRPRSYRRLAEEGVPARTVERALGLVRDMLASEGPLTRAEIGERLRRRRVPTDGQALHHLTWLTAADGTVCFGPTRSGRLTFVLVRDWMGKTEAMDRDRALAELAVRYLAAHGPSLREDLAYWSGLRGPDVRRAWGLVADRLVEVVTGGVVRWRLKGLRTRTGPAPVRLLPMFDEYLLGWRSRDLVVADRHRQKVIPGGGMIHQSVVANGTIRGTWSAAVHDETLVVTVPLFGRSDASLRGALLDEAEDVRRFRGLRAAELELEVATR